MLVKNYKDDLLSLLKLNNTNVRFDNIKDYLELNDNADNRSGGNKSGNFYDSSLIDFSVDDSKSEGLRTTFKTGDFVVRQSKGNEVLLYGTYDHAGLIDMRNSYDKLGNRINITKDTRLVWSSYPENSVGFDTSSNEWRKQEKNGKASYEPIGNHTMGEKFVLLRVNGYNDADRKNIGESAVNTGTEGFNYWGGNWYNVMGHLYDYDIYESDYQRYNSPFSKVDQRYNMNYCSYMPYFAYGVKGKYLNADFGGWKRAGASVVPDDLYESKDNHYATTWVSVSYTSPQLWRWVSVYYSTWWGGYTGGYWQPYYETWYYSTLQTANVQSAKCYIVVSKER